MVHDGTTSFRGDVQTSKTMREGHSSELRRLALTAIPSDGRLVLLDHRIASRRTVAPCAEVGRDSFDSPRALEPHVNQMINKIEQIILLRDVSAQQSSYVDWKLRSKRTLPK